jgi:hypothetical protein
MAGEVLYQDSEEIKADNFGVVEWLVDDFLDKLEGLE